MKQLLMQILRPEINWICENDSDIEYVTDNIGDDMIRIYNVSNVLHYVLSCCDIRRIIRGIIIASEGLRSIIIIIGYYLYMIMLYDKRNIANSTVPSKYSEQALALVLALVNINTIL